ncbi:MAG: 3-oxoacyl-[acyl-carrier-protein] synthase III C-terminal domain-containing protein [Pseudomonadota bacterium]
MALPSPSDLPKIRLLSLATAVPPHVIEQETVAAHARQLFPSRGRALDRLLPVFENAGITKRHSCQPIDWYLEAKDWQTRNDLYVENAVALLEQAADRCLTKAGLSPHDVDAVVAVSTTGVATPSLDARLVDRLSLRRDVQRLPIFGLGCAGGVLGLGRAAAMARGMPGSKVLFLVVELCALTFRLKDQSNSNIVATALFGDGAAAVLLEAGDQQSSANGAEITAWGEHTWPDSLDVMGWSVENDGLGVIFSKDIPTIVRKQMTGAADAFLSQQGLSRADLSGYVCHPGGAKVIRALEEAFELGPEALQDAKEALRQYGNMSAASVLFVLERGLERGLHGRHLMTALGPGFTAGFVLLDCPREPNHQQRQAAE